MRLSHKTVRVFLSHSGGGICHGFIILEEPEDGRTAAAHEGTGSTESQHFFFDLPHDRISVKDEFLKCVTKECAQFLYVSVANRFCQSIDIRMIR